MLATEPLTTIQTAKTTIALRVGGAGPPLLLLHGFPQTHLMWDRIAPILARRFTLVCPDLRGYSQSGCPPTTPDHAPYAKRAMARDMVEVMKHVGYAAFPVAGHDRGGRADLAAGRRIASPLLAVWSADGAVGT